MVRHTLNLDGDYVTSAAMEKFYSKIDRRRDFGVKLTKLKNKIFNIQPTRISDEELALWAELEKFDGEKFSIAEADLVFTNRETKQRWGYSW